MIATILGTSILIIVSIIFRLKWLVICNATILLLVQCFSILLDPGVTARKVIEKIHLSKETEDGMQGVKMFIAEFHNVIDHHLVLAIGMFILLTIGLFCKKRK